MAVCIYACSKEGHYHYIITPYPTQSSMHLSILLKTTCVSLMTQYKPKLPVLLVSLCLAEPAAAPPLFILMVISPCPSCPAC